MDFSIVYSSKTGNTKMLADTIYKCLDKDECKYYGDINNYNLDINDIFVGFWTDKGTADETSLEFLKSLKNKNIFLFGTAGFGESEVYFKNIINNIMHNIDKTNKVKGAYMCQGKMPFSVRDRYEKIKKEGDKANIDALIDNFDKALSHPDNNDLKELTNMIKSL